MWQWCSNCWQFNFPVKHLCTKTNGREEERGWKENYFINPSSVLFLPISWSCSWGESILQLTAVHQWLYQTTIRLVTEGKQKGLERRKEEKKICKVREKKCQQGSCIRQSDTQLPLPLSLTNNRAACYKLPCDSVWITLDWKIWTGWRGVKGRRVTPLYSGQRVVRVAIWVLSDASNRGNLQEV